MEQLQERRHSLASLNVHRALLGSIVFKEGRVCSVLPAHTAQVQDPCHVRPVPQAHTPRTRGLPSVPLVTQAPPVVSERLAAQNARQGSLLSIIGH